MVFLTTQGVSSWFLTHSASISSLWMRIIIMATSPDSCVDQNIRSCFITEEVERAIHILNIMVFPLEKLSEMIDILHHHSVVLVDNGQS